MPGAMRHSVQHLYALDVACGGGLEVKVDGKLWTFSPLSFGNARKVIMRARSDAVQAYHDAMRDQEVPHRQRAMDLSAILFGTEVQEALTDPATRLYQLELSLRTVHTKETDQEIQEVLKKLCETEEGATEIVEAVKIMTHGPYTEADLASGEDGAENPTSTEAPSASGSASAT